MDARIEKKRLLEAIPIEQEILDEAILAIKESRRYLGLGPSVITSIVVGLCHFTFTRTIDTFAVKLASDGNPMLMINPDFLIKIGPQQAVFALSHEAYHLLLVHLYTDPELMKNQNWILATEACINFRIKKHLKLPLIQLDGKVVIVDPDKIYDSYRQSMKKIEKEPVSKDDFYATDIGCFAHLEGLPKPLSSKQGGCVHFSDAQNGNGNAPLDPTEVSKFMDKVLSGAIQSAKNGRQGAKEEILNWMDSSPEASQTWGDLGAGTLRGETTKSRKTDLWEKWTSDAIGSKLRDGNRWKYNRKIHWDPRVSANGKQPHKHGAVFIDASGSMHQEVLDRVSGMIGDLDNITVEWHSFDGSVWPFATGEGFKGGGGTSFHVIEDHIVNHTLADGSTEACCDDDLDFVLVLTDGYAPELIPSDPDKWIWLIVPGGTTWPLDSGMSCREIDPINS
jgi:predicted metal-dependent peptidase